MSGKLKLFIISLALISTSLLQELNATHIVGGDMTYKCIGNNEYEITLTFSRDCEYGADDAQFDNYAIVAIYDQYYNPVNLGANGLVSIPYVSDDTLYTSLENDCEIIGYEVCVHQSVYRDTVFLLPKTGGYILSYQRCCRNSTLLNIEDPLETGSTETIHITEEAFTDCNSSPAFNVWPDIYVCTNKSIDFDHSATDIDGDSLVYKLYTPFKGASVANPRPDRFDEFDVPYTLLEWAPGYSEDNMLGGPDPLAIDPNTGMISGTPTQEGQFVVGIMVEEYRKGKLLSVVRRDFEFNVRVCMEPPIADFIAPDVLCGSDDFEVLFTNTSQNADGYYWQFDYPSQDADKVSIEENPSYTYPNNSNFSGKDTFTVSLKAIRSVDQCFDVISKDIIIIQDELFADFQVSIQDCPGDSLDLMLEDLSVSLNPLYTIDSWNWTITLEDGTTITGTGKDLLIRIEKQGKLTVKLEISSTEGCDASIEKEEIIDYLQLDFIANPIAICKGDSSSIVANPNSNWTYTWSPEEGLYFDDPNDKSDPMCYIEQDTTYYVTVTDGICTIIDSVEVKVKDYLDIYIEGPEFVCDEYITLIAHGGEAGFTIFEWSENADFNPVVAEGDTVEFYINGYMVEYFLRVKEGTGCSNSMDSFTAFNNSIDLDYNDVEEYCYGMERDIILTNNRPNDTLIFTWEPNPYITSALDTNFVSIYSDVPGTFDLIFHVINQFGCELTDTITVNSNEGPSSLDIDANLECGSFEYCFTAFGGAGTDYVWDFGDPNTTDDTSTEANPCYTYPSTGTYLVTVSAYFEECGGILTSTKEIVVPDAFELMGKDTVVYCDGETLMLSVNPSNFSMDVTWYDENDNVVGSGIMIEYTPLGDETLTIVAVDTFGCTDSLNMFLDLFEFDLSKDNPGTLCAGDTTLLSVYNNTVDLLNYSWEDKANIISPLDESSITVVLDQDDDYVVTVTSAEHGCETEVTISVLVSNIQIDIETDTLIIVITKSTELTVTGNYDEFADILWSNGAKTETIEVFPTESTTYCVTVTDEFGCSDEACVDVTVIDPFCDERDIFIPNAFSPNDDDNIPDNNDIFRPRSEYLEEVEITIFNRWGQELFNINSVNLNDPEEAFWDGTYNGQFLGPDSYAYIIRILCEDGDRYQEQGNISIIK